MALPPLWKIRREIWRMIGNIRAKFLRMTGNREYVAYRGLKVPTNRAGMRGDVFLALCRNYYEAPEIEGIKHAVRDGDRVLELGSGMAIVTALAGRAAGQNGRVLSFEANATLIPDSLKFLQDHDISNVEIRNAVLVPDATGGATRSFHISRSFASSSLLDSSNNRTEDIVDVPAIAINEVMSEFQPNVLLCDIEGGEFELIPALDATGLKAVVMELHPDRLSEDQIKTIYDALEKQGLMPSDLQLGGTVVLFERAG